MKNGNSLHAKQGEVPAKAVRMDKSQVVINLTNKGLLLALKPDQLEELKMVVVNGIVEFEDNEKDMWEKLLEREISSVPPQLLRELGEARVKELTDEGSHIWARMAAKHVEDIPQFVLH